MKEGKDLTKVAPRSPKEIIGGFAIIARTIDKCRALLWGNIGEYHFNCPLDNMLFGFKGIQGDDFKAFVETGATDEEIVAWVKATGVPKSEAEIEEWSSTVDPMYAEHPDEGKRAWFVGECERLGLNPATTSLFDYLDEDDRVSYGK